MQATVSRYDETSHDGDVLLDDGIELPFSAQALQGTGLRLLRPGQRVRVTVAGEGAERHVAALQILTLA
jgi:2-phospho-L-lactate guanylyltransferase